MAHASSFPSADLTWLLLRNSSSFAVKGRSATRQVLAGERGNLRNVHCARYSGLSRSRAVDLNTNENGTLTLSFKSKRASSRRKPAGRWSSVALKRDFRRNAKTIKAVVDNYSPDLTKSALARWSKISRVQRAVAKDVKKKAQKKDAKEAK